MRAVRSSSCCDVARISMMMAPLELLLLLLEAYYLVVYVAFVVGLIRLVWKWLLRLVLHWALEMVRCCSLMFLPSFRCHLLLFGFDPAKLCCRRHLGSSQGTMDNSPNSKSLLPNQRGRSTVGRCRRRCTTAKVGQTLGPMPCRYLDIPGCMTLMVLPELLLRPHLEHKDPRRGRLADPRFRFRKSQGPTPLAFDEALLVDISGQVCLGKNSGRNRSFCFLCCWPATGRTATSEMDLAEDQRR